MSLQDLYGNAVSSHSRPAVDAYDRGVRGLLGFSADIIDSFRAALATDPDFVLARAALAVALFLAEQMTEARTEMQRASASAATLPPRERRLFAVHLRFCSVCREYLARYRATIAAAKSACIESPNLLETVPSELLRAVLGALPKRR